MTSDDGALGLAADEPDLDGHSMEELSEYLDNGRRPYDASIEDSAASVLALAALQRLNGVAADLMERVAEPRPGAVDQWVAGVLTRISLDARAGRDLPLAAPPDGDALLVTEGALRSLVRGAGDRLPGTLIGRVTIDGDLGTPTAEVALRVEMDIVFGMPIPGAVDRLREAIAATIRRHTTFRTGSIDVVVRDLHLPVAP